MILGKKPNLIENWPKMWPTCFLRPWNSLDGLKSDFWGWEIDLAKFCGKWPKIRPTCIFRPGKSLDGLKCDFGGEKKIQPNFVENGRKYGQHVFLGLGRVQKA